MNMVGVVRKLTKTIVLSVGTVILGAVCAVGGAGLYFKEDAVKFYTQIRNEVTSMSSTLDNGIDQFNKTISEVQTLPENLKTEFAKHQKDFGDIAAKLEQQASELEKNPIIPSTWKTKNGSQTAQQLRDLATKIKEASNAINTGVNTIAGQVDSVTNSQIVEQIKTFLNTVKTDYLPKVNQITTEVTPEKFSEYYGFTSTVMVAVSGSILGLGLLSGLLTYAFYKNVDGKLVRKSSKKNELTNHVKYILKKYPEIKEKIVDEF